MSTTTMSSSHIAAAAPWADLLPEMCGLVVDRLDALSVIRFPATCADWSAASSQTPRLRSGAPALLTSGLDPDGYGIEYSVEAGVFALHDVATGKSFPGEAEGLKNRTWIGGKDDWLVTTDERCSVELLNPITGVRVPLPSFTTMEGVKVPDHEGLCVAVENRSHTFQQVALCQTPAHPGGYLAVALFSSVDGLLAFTAAGDKCWTPLKNPAGYHPQYTDVTVHKGKVLAVVESGDIYSWAMDGTAAEPTLVPGPEVHVDPGFKKGFYLAESTGGRLQVVCLYGQHGGHKDKRMWRMVFKDQWSVWPPRVSLHELDAVAGTWRRVRDLGGDRALFVGANYPFYATVVPGESKDLQPDCIYVSDLDGSDTGIFDLKLRDDYEYFFVRELSYPVLWGCLQMPMWYRPTAHSKA
ncbi:hypothetical protein BS78_06G262600 [Paspalum vaginatum]|nr:hypothetical protein BS78_06G262600 [Paspalum vaginatum]